MNSNSNNNEESNYFLGLTLIPENEPTGKNLVLLRPTFTKDFKLLEYLFYSWDVVKDAPEYKATAEAWKQKGVVRNFNDINIDLQAADLIDSWMQGEEIRGVLQVGSVVIAQRINPETKQTVLFSVTVFETEEQAIQYVKEAGTKPLRLRVGVDCEAWYVVRPDAQDPAKLNDVEGLGKTQARHVAILAVMPNESLEAIGGFLSDKGIYELCFK